jgi:hypothetical protein
MAFRIRTKILLLTGKVVVPAKELFERVRCTVCGLRLIIYSLPKKRRQKHKNNTYTNNPEVSSSPALPLARKKRYITPKPWRRAPTAKQGTKGQAQSRKCHH